MKLEVNGNDIDLGDNLRGHVEDALHEIKDKYFDYVSHATVFFSKERHLFKVDIHMNVGRGILLKGSAEGDEIYPAFDGAVDRIGKRLRKYKSKLRDHHAKEDVATAAQMLATEKTFETNEDDEEVANQEPVVVAEIETLIEDLTVSEAMMRLELGDLPAIMFRERVSGRMNMLYRRNDGNIGWVDPQKQ